VGWVSVGTCLLALGLGCGGTESDELFEEPPPANPVMTMPPAVEMAPPEAMVQPVSPTPSTEGNVASEMAPLTPAVEENLDPNVCRPALGVSGRPATISEAIILLNTLPKPVTLACFLQALDRPLTLYMTKSDDSLQPSPGERSPRTFILNGDLEMSIVLDGDARNTLEFGYRPESTRSIKAEIEFPLTADVSERRLFDRVQVTERTTKCGACHVGEAKEEFPGFPLGVFASDVIMPFDMDAVTIDSMKAEHAACDPATEEYRCGLLSALFDQGEVVPGFLQGVD
jgi:hypothetical protein